MIDLQQRRGERKSKARIMDWLNYLNVVYLLKIKFTIFSKFPHFFTHLYQQVKLGRAASKNELGVIGDISA